MKIERYSTGGVGVTMERQPSEALPGYLTGYKTQLYRTFVLLLLLLVYTLNTCDRAVLSVLAQPIISTFHLTDTQWGLLSGPPFAVFYVLMGLPLAILADRSRRVTILACCILVWSIMTALCGLASGFLILLLARVGVAIGEAGCGPVSNSLIGDYFKPTERPKVLSIWALGVPIGLIVANLFGGAIAGLPGDVVGDWGNRLGLAYLFPGIWGAHVDGWRLAFILVGAPGLLVAPLIYLSVKEPPRGYSDPPAAMPKGSLNFASGFKELLGKRSYWWLVLGSMQIGLAIYAITGFQLPLLQRLHGLNIQQAAVQFGLPISVASGLGTFFCGWLVEKLSSRHFSAVAWVPAIGAILAVPFYLIAFNSTDLTVVLIFFLLGAFFHYSSIGSQYAIGQGVVSNRSRAVAIALLLFIVSGVGGSAGAYLLGWVSDAFASSYLHASDVAASLTPRLCKVQPGLTDAQVHACQLASSHGLRDAMSLIVCILIPAGLCFVMCGLGLKKDYVARMEE